MQHLAAAARILRHELTAFLCQVDENGERFAYGKIAGVPIDDHRHPGERVELEKIRLAVRTGLQINYQMRRVGKPALLEHHMHFLAVGGRRR